jgi:predicted transcriptional regulator of viral defense system
MIHDQRSILSRYVNSLLARGQTVFTASEAEAHLKVDRGAFLDAAERLQRRKLLLSPRRGFYLAVPQQFANWGAPPPSWFLDDLMRFEEEPYYVALLKAAELHGATHQAVMEFQVITAKRFANIRAGRSVIAFYYRKDMDAIARGLEKHKTDTGSMQVASPALTALDLIRYPQASAGIDHVATVLSDLARRIDAKPLAALSVAFERPVVQRLGCLLDQLGHSARTDRLHTALTKRGAPQWTELDRREIRDPDFTPEPVLRDPRWHVIVRRMPEVDE